MHEVLSPRDVKRVSFWKCIFSTLPLFLCYNAAGEFENRTVDARINCLKFNESGYGNIVF